ncbi:MAG: glycoside hydrolase family 2, partial [Halanaerobiales bacterium]
RNGKQLVGTWKIPYRKAELKAIAYDEKGEVIATDVRRAFGDAEKIRLKSSKNMLLADGRDLIFVEITVEDREGNPVENATNRVNVEVSGAGRLIGLDNGDSTDYDQYKGLSRRLFSGKLMAVIAAKLEPGPIKVEVSSKGLESKSAVYQAIPVESEDIEGITADMENQMVPVVMGDREEIPVRKIDIISNSVRVLDESVEEVNVKARLYRDNTSYQDVEWSIVNDTGIELDIAEIEAEGLEARVRAFGDGKFRVRCTSKNGTDSTKIISELEFKAVGIGTSYKDPYSFISAGLYDYSKGEVGNGNERGVATARDGETQVGFRDIDFGPVGSDTITIPIFALSSDEYSLQIYEGMPEEEDSELIADVTYQKETRWNVYQEETYKLSRRLKGITSICFVLNKKVHIKGFSFKKKSRAFEQIFAAESDHIYGDTYTINEKRVEGIGNNVSLEFNNMDFGNDGAAKLVICGKSPIDINTIHIKFTDEADELESGQSDSGKSYQNLNEHKGSNLSEGNQIVEFTQSEDYEERVFELGKVTGRQKVTFVFLPGSNFDFAWFRFEN